MNKEKPNSYEVFDKSWKPFPSALLSLIDLGTPSTAVTSVSPTSHVGLSHLTQISGSLEHSEDKVQL